jgi:hypothetical protein
MYNLALLALASYILIPIFIVFNFGVIRSHIYYLIIMVICGCAAVSYYIRDPHPFAVQRLVSRNRTTLVLMGLIVAADTIPMIFYRTYGPDTTGWARLLIGVRFAYVMGLLLAANRLRYEKSLHFICFLLIFAFSLTIFEFFLEAAPLAFFQEVFKVNDALTLVSVAVKTRAGFVRCSSLFQHPIVLGIVAGAFAPLLFAFMTNAKVFSQKLYYGIGTALALFSVFACNSRSGPAVLIVSGGVYLCYLSSWHHFVRKTRTLYILVPLLIAGAVVTLPIALGLFYGSTGEEAVSTQGRALAWLNAIPYMLRSPLFGWGYGSDAKLAGIPIVGTTHSTIDDSYLSMLMNTGLIGFGLFFAILGYVLLKSRSVIMKTDDVTLARTRIALVAALVGIAVGQKGNSISYNFTFFFLIIGMFASSSLYSVKSLVRRDGQTATEAA